MSRPSIVFQLFLRSSRVQNKRALLTVAAIAWGSLSLVLLLAFGEGMKRQLTRAQAGLGRNIAIIGAFRGDFRLSFFDAALLKDPDGVLERQGANTPHPDMIRFSESSDVSRLAPTIRSYLRESMGYAEAGLRPEKESVELEIPTELKAAMDVDETIFARINEAYGTQYALRR